jgi:lysophospholipase L1-like esterase
MKKFLAAGLTAGCLFTAHAQTNSSGLGAATVIPPVDQAVESPSEPLDTTSPDNTRYLHDPALLTECNARLAAIGEGPCDIIFIGASIISRWPTIGKDSWDKSYAPRHALDFGVDGDKTQNVLWRLNNMSIQSLKPKVAVVLIGSNNTMNSPHEIADGIKAVLANTEEAFSGVKIILVSLLPNERANDKMMQVNSLVRGYADNEHVYFLNLVPLMPEISGTGPDGQPRTNWKGLGPDRLHPDATGYQIWADAMEPLLTKLLGAP